jgi:hypothetical protein
MRTVEDTLEEDMKLKLHKAIREVFDEQYSKRPSQPDYYTRRKHGKWTIYKKDGMRVVGRLNEKEMKAYMKLLKEEK